RLRTPAHERIQRHQCPVRVLVRWRSANQRFKLSDGTLVLMERGVDPTQLHQELFVNRAKLSSFLRAPVGIAILTEQIAAVHPERLFVVGRDARLDGATRKPLELLDVDPQITRRAKLHLLAGRDDELRIRAGGQLRLESAARKMNDLMEIRRTR